MTNSETRALIDVVFGAATHPLAAWYANLLDTTPSLRAFTTANGSKIRKKTRLARTAEEQRDLRCELAVAATLAADRRSSLTYEPLAATGQRGPDFLLRYKGHSDVYVEVSRLRPPRKAGRDPSDRLGAILCAKLGQLVVGAANLLVLVSDDAPFSAATVGAVLQGLRQRADAKDDAFFAFRGLAGTRMFLQAIPRLSGVLLVAPAPRHEVLSLRPQARHILPADLARAAESWDLATRIGPPDAEAAHDE